MEELGGGEGKIPFAPNLATCGQPLGLGNACTQGPTHPVANQGWPDPLAVADPDDTGIRAESKTGNRGMWTDSVRNEGQERM